MRWGRRWSRRQSSRSARGVASQKENVRQTVGVSGAEVSGDRVPGDGALDERKAAILRAVVEEYIDTAQPVASAHVARIGNLGVSAATVRNEMAVLEREGFLAHPHTSAGRVPTDLAYRFFVDSLSEPSDTLNPADKQQRVQDFFARTHGELEQMLNDTTALLSNLTSYAALVVAPAHEDATIRSAHIVALTPLVAVVVAVLSNGAVDKATVEFDRITTPEMVEAAGADLNAHLVGWVVTDERPVPTSGDQDRDRVSSAARQALLESHRHEPEHVYVGGTSQMAATFSAVESVREVLAILEQQYVVVSLLKEALVYDERRDNRIGVVIGAEHRVESLAECSIVVAPYDVGGNRAGTIGILGPTRMNYPDAMAAVAVVGRRLGRHLSEG